jgi:predicted ferric reductase
MTAGTLALVVFLSLKNTPLAYLTAYSYERLNNLHQIAGCTMFLFMCLHAITYTAYFGRMGKLSIVTQPAQRAAIVAGFAFLGSFVAAMFIRRIYYELFYAMHIIFFIIGIVCVCFHQPDFGLGIVSIMIFAAAIWLLDRAFRASRVVYNSINNDATVYPLPNGGTRVVLKKTPPRAVPGKHCFLWIPKIRLAEMHPFTIVGTQPMEFCINSYDGFTAALHRYAVKNPGGNLKASVDGPYGTFPDPMEYDKIVLIAGGSGASFTFGMAENLLERMNEESRKKIVFIWAVKSTGWLWLVRLDVASSQLLRNTSLQRT